MTAESLLKKNWETTSLSNGKRKLSWNGNEGYNRWEVESLFSIMINTECFSEFQEALEYFSEVSQ